MKTGKVAAVGIAVAIVGLFYSGKLVFHAESEVMLETAVNTPSGEQRPAKKAVILPKQKTTTKTQKIRQKRKKLLAAMAVARKRRLARTTRPLASPATQADPADAPALPASRLDKDYIRDQVSEIRPLIRGCFERMLLRRPNVGGKAVVEFSIVGEEDVGGLVEMSEYDHEASTIDDAQFSECIQETMYAAEFEPPDGGGRVVIRYPFHFHLADSPEE